MARDLESLTLEFHNATSQLLANCLELGIEMVPFCTLRSPQAQAVLWRQSRSVAEVMEGIERLRSGGAPWLAEVLDGVGPQLGKGEVTKALPGLSWHQWGEAVDCYWLRDGKAQWNGPGYDTYRLEAEKLGLTQVTWERVHVQLRKDGSPAKMFPMSEIDAIMKEKFGE